MQRLWVRVPPLRRYDLVAQLVLEHLTFNEGVVSSSLTGVTKVLASSPSREAHFNKTCHGENIESADNDEVPTKGYALLAQLVVAIALHAIGHRFDPYRVYKNGSIGRVPGRVCKTSPWWFDSICSHKMLMYRWKLISSILVAES